MDFIIVAYYSKHTNLYIYVYDRSMIEFFCFLRSIEVSVLSCKFLSWWQWL